MSLADKIALIDQERRRVEDQFNTELNAGLVQYHALKTKEETDVRQAFEKKELEAERIRTTPTDITTTFTPTGKQRITKGRTGDVIKTETEIGMDIPKVGYKEIKSGNEIITFQDGVEIARSPRWKPETIKSAKAEKKDKAISKIEVEIRDLETDVAGYRQEISSAKPDEDGTEGVFRGNYFFPTSDILLDINKAQSKIRKKREQIDKLSKAIENKIKKAGLEETETIEQKQEGETIEDYLKRIGK